MRTILVVEDNPLHKRLFSDVLRHFGYRVFSTSRGEEVLEVVYRELPDLIIVDCFLGTIQGSQVVRSIRNDTRFRQTPILATSAFATDAEVVEMSNVGCSGYVEKPVSVRSLASIIDRTLGRPNASITND